MRLGDICDFINGGAWSDKEYVSSGLPVLKVSNCKTKGFQIEDINYLPLSSKEKYAKNKLRLGDVIIATVGSHPNLVESAAGRSCVVTEFVDSFYLNQNAVCLRTKDNDILNQTYLGYLCRERIFVNYIQNKGRGAANQMRIAIGAIKDFEFELPDIEVQIQIAKILSAYDKLIENNQKQIKLLEEAAQRLYKEWFVDLRFPGYEDVEIVDDIPNGWRNAQLGDVIDINKENISKNYSYDHIDYIDISSVRTGAILNTNFYALADAPGRAKRCIHDGDVIWGMVRPNLKSYALIMNPTNTMIASTGFAVLTPKNIPFTFLYCIVTQEAFVGYLINCTNGAAYPAVKPIHFQQSPVLIPTDELLNQFHLITEPLFRKIDTLHMQVNILTEARDRLLPKLMNGLIEI